MPCHSFLPAILQVSIPPLPPRATERLRDLSNSPQLDGSIDQLVNTNIPPPRVVQKSHSNDQLRGGNVAEGIVGSSHIIPPYSVTTIKKDTQSAPPPHYMHQQQHSSYAHTQDNCSSGADPSLNSHVPPPAILGQPSDHVQQQQPPSTGLHGDPDPDTGIYYTPQNNSSMEKKQQRMLTKDGVFVSRNVSSPSDSIEHSARDGVRYQQEGE